MNTEMGGANAKISLEPNRSEDQKKVPTDAEDDALSDGEVEINADHIANPIDESTDNQYFFEDEVFMIDKKGRARFGLVIETSDSFSDDEEDYEEILRNGQVRVAWYPDGKEYVYSDGDLGLVDRTLMPGDVVKRFAPTSEHTQHGYCRNIQMKTDVKVLGTKYVIQNVDASRLRLISVWQRDNPVCLDSWVGSTKEVEEKAILKLPSGCRFEIPCSYFYCFKDPKTRYMQGIYNPQIFYPGNVITGRLPSLDNIKLLTPHIPFQKNRKGKISSTKFTVEDVYTESVWVHWQCKALSEEPNAPSCALQNPQSYVSGEDLKRLKKLNLFESCMLQINDRGFLTYEQFDKLITKSQWDQEQTLKYKLIFNEQQGKRKQTPFMSSDTNKFKKKPTTIESDKSNKSKKILLKVEKTNNSKDKSVSVENSLKKLRSTNEDVDWVSEEEEAIDNSLIDVEAAGSTATSTGSNSSSRSSPRRISDRARKVKTLKKKCCKVASVEFTPKVGDRLVAEALLVYSTATVVWQDGSIEDNIPSTELYPLHHLDNHEFFPGDFVIMSKEETDMSSFRDYGVVQTVDHEGRIARVKWFTTYNTSDEPQPSFNGETEVSVYDLKDHPDFQYRPGTMVIRVANFVGEDANCTAGQIVDNFTDGRVRVWWVDGHTSMCWPQDLFEVGQHDQGDLNQETDSESWETESDESEISSRSIITESQTLLNIDRAREAIARLEDIFRISPSLQNSEVMQKLLNIYKICRYFDRLLNTNFFHEKNFMGLIERVRKHGNTEFLLERSSRLLNQSTQKPTCQIQAVVAVNSTQKPININSHASPNSNASTKEYAPKVLFNIATHAHKAFSSSSPMTVLGLNSTSRKASSFVVPRTEKYEEKTSAQTISLSNLPQPQTMNRTLEKIPNPSRCSSMPPVISKESQKTYNVQKIELLSSAIFNIEKAYEQTSLIKWTNAKIGSDTSCKNIEVQGSTTSNTTHTESNWSLPNVNEETQLSNIELEEDIAPQLMCVRLCSLLKVQLRNCFEEISQKFYNKRQNKNKSKHSNGANIERQSSEEDVQQTCGDESNVPQDSLSLCSIAASESVTEILSNSTVQEMPNIEYEYFQMISNAPKTHKYYSTAIEPVNPQQYSRTIQREHHMLQKSLPPGAWVRVFEDRMDLMSVMLLGPKNTPYEDGIFLFDMQLGNEYPKSPPTCHYISFCTDRLNPNLYEDGKVCVSLLGTWSGRDTEVWGPKSSILQVIVSIQGLILVPEPYFNEAGYEKQKGSQLGKENSRMYNEMAVIKMVQATTKIMENPVELFRKEILKHFKSRGQHIYNRIKEWIELSKTEGGAEKKANDTVNNCSVPEFPLIPASKGFCLTLSNILCTFKSKLDVLKLAPLPHAENLNELNEYNN